MKNLKIRAYLQTPVISDGFLPLDSFLYYQHVRNILGAEIIAKPNEPTIKDTDIPSLPLHKSGENEKWFYNSSFAIWPKCTIEGSSFKVQQGDWVRYLQYLSDKAKKIDIMRGKFKVNHIKLYYRFARYIDWYCLGNLEKIQKLLNFTTAIGKNTGDGWGQILRWELQEVEQDYSVFGKNGELMRAIPSASGIPYGIRPSYWDKEHIFTCQLPGR